MTFGLGIKEREAEDPVIKLSFRVSLTTVKHSLQFY